LFIFSYTKTVTVLGEYVLSSMMGIIALTADSWKSAPPTQTIHHLIIDT